MNEDITRDILQINDFILTYHINLNAILHVKLYN